MAERFKLIRRDLFEHGSDDDGDALKMLDDLAESCAFALEQSWGVRVVRLSLTVEGKPSPACKAGLLRIRMTVLWFMVGAGAL